MTEINNKILKLIKSEKSMRDMCMELKISEKQLYYRIKQLINQGYQIGTAYFYNNDIKYSLYNGLAPENKNEIDINMISGKEFRCVVISDTHIGNANSDVRLLNSVYDYATKNGINTILFCGDMIDGTYTGNNTVINNLDEQINTLIKKYPYDKNIMNYGIFGNHEYHHVYTDGIDIIKRIHNCRYDIVPIGYGDGIVKLKNDSILLYHDINLNNDAENSNVKVALLGHGHEMRFKIANRLNLGVPSLSYVSTGTTSDVLPGFIDLSISFNKHNFDYLISRHMVLLPQIKEASITRCKLSKVFDNYEYPTEQQEQYYKKGYYKGKK